MGNRYCNPVPSQVGFLVQDPEKCWPYNARCLESAVPSPPEVTLQDYAKFNDFLGARFRRLLGVKARLNIRFGLEAVFRCNIRQ